MLRLLIAEDEAVFLEGLVESVDWASIGVEVCGTATNGGDALALAEELQPDLLLTDIRMPRMDGLELVETLVKHQQNVACILLTGYGDFHYALKAMRLGVSDYLVKPCRPAELIAVFQKVIEKLLQKREMEDDLSGLRRRLQENEEAAKRKHLLQWLKSPKSSAGRKELIGKYRMVIGQAPYWAAALRIDAKSLRRLDYGQSEMDLLRYAAVNIAYETLHAEYPQIEITYDDRDLFVVSSGAEYSVPKLRRALIRLQHNLNGFLRLTVSIGVSGSFASMDQLHDACEQSLEALETSFFKGTGHIYFVSQEGKPEEADADSEHGDSAKKNEATLEHLEQLLIDYMKNGLHANALTTVEQWFAYFQRESSAYSHKEIRLHTLSLLARFMQLSKEMDVRDSPWKNQLVELAERVNHAETLEELDGLVSLALKQWVEATRSEHAPKRKVEQALELIFQHYNSSELSLSFVAQSIFVSPSYLSTLFKQETGMNFLDYVHQYRIERAKPVLLSGQMKIYQIAREIGYFDEAHFTRTFKKWTGKSPSQFQKNPPLEEEASSKQSNGN